MEKDGIDNAHTLCEEIPMDYWNLANGLGVNPCLCYPKFLKNNMDLSQEEAPANKY